MGEVYLYCALLNALVVVVFVLKSLTRCRDAENQFLRLTDHCKAQQTTKYQVTIYNIRGVHT